MITLFASSTKGRAHTSLGPKTLKRAPGGYKGFAMFLNTKSYFFVHLCFVGLILHLSYLTAEKLKQKCARATITLYFSFFETRSTPTKVGPPG